MTPPDPRDNPDPLYTPEGWDDRLDWREVAAIIEAGLRGPVTGDRPGVKTWTYHFPPPPRPSRLRRLIGWGRR